MSGFAKRLAVVALSLAAALAPAMAKDWKTIRIGTEGAYPPFNNLNSKGELEGFEIDYAKALCAKMKVECTFVAQDWDGIIPALLSNKFDVIIASMSITDERKKKVDFTDPYYDTPAAFIAPKSTTSTDISPAALKGKLIGAQGSTTHSNFLEKTYKDSQIKLYQTQDEANLDLLNGRLDYVEADKVVLSDFLKGKGKDCCHFVSDVVKDRSLFGNGVGMAVRKEDTDLKAMLNKAIADAQADGTFKKIQDQYFDFNIF
jgi:polar amino acid transport system substrate-binding protein